MIKQWAISVKLQLPKCILNNSLGQVSQKKTERNKVWIRLGSRMGTIEGELSKSKINAKVREQYQSIQLGDRVAFKGSFNTELGNTAYFTIEELIPSPHY